MARHLAQGSTSSASTPLLDVWISNGKVLVDPDAGTLTFSVYDISTEEKEADGGVLVFGPHTVDLTADRLSLDTLTSPPEPGHFAAAWSVSSSEPTGAHEIRWSWTYTTVPPATVDTETRSYSYVERFDVLSGVPRGLGGGGLYALVSDFRAEGFEPEMVGDVRLLRIIAEQSRYFDDVTQRFFEPRFIDVSVDGTDARQLLLGHPIIALDGVAILDDPIAIDPTSRELVVYNRHIGGFTDPDDRDAPRIEIPEVYSYVDPYGSAYSVCYPYPPLREGFPRSSQNVHVQGLFGYTDPDGSTIGQTPSGVKRAVMLLVKRNLPKLACDNELLDARMSGRVTQMRTRDQHIVFADAGLGEGEFTGDIEVDRAIGKYRRPVRCAAT